MERRRVLDAGAAELLLGSLADAGEYVQTGESLALQEGESGQETNLAPANVELTLSANVIFENEVLQLGVTFEDPNEESDTHTVTIDWGDGTPTETILLDTGDRFLKTSHRYLDDNPTSTPLDFSTIRVSVFDAAGEQATAAARVQVTNVAPFNVHLEPVARIDENGIAQVTLTFDDPGTLDSYYALFLWGDGSSTEFRDLAPGTRSIETSHQYLDDDPTSTPSDVYDIRVFLIDDDSGLRQASGQVLVENVAPLLSVAGDQIVEEGALLDLTGGGLGSFVDVGKLDTHTATVSWGDGTATETVTVNQAHGAGTLEASHRFSDNGLYTVTVELKDDDGGVDTKSFLVTVGNVAPELVVVGDQTIDEGAVLHITDLGTFTDPGFDNPLNTLDPSNGGQTQERFFFKIDWGDTTLTNEVPATIDLPGGPGVATAGSFDGSHVYADNGLYTVTVQLRDDDGGLATKTFQVLVNNVDPVLVEIDPLPTVAEGTLFTLTELGVTLADPGFDNPFNPIVLGGSEETFTSLSIDWGDGRPADPLSVVNRVGGSQGTATTAEFEHTPRAYADNGLYTVTITVADDDGELVARAFQIQVNNVAPTLVLTSRELEINEGETLDLFDLGTFSDPGFDNLLNTGDPSNGGEVSETFSYTIDWGDGTIESGQLPATAVSGAIGMDSLGTLVDSHHYLDNDLDSLADNLYTITVTLSDDDGGSVSEQVIARVLNVNPSLEPILATDVNTKGETTLTLEFADPGTEVLTVWVDWGDQLALPPAQRFVSETFILGPGTQNLTLLHVYSGPPDPLSPASDIILSVFIRDDDFGEPLVFDPGQSETLSVAISNPGAGVNPIVIDTTPQVPRLVFPQQEENTFFVGATSSDESGAQTADLRTAVGDTKSTTDRYLELRVIDPASGEQSEGYRLKSEVLNDLPGLFRTLPDNRYAIYLVRTETNTRRLVIEVYVRNGKLIDPGDDTEGTRDRPPTEEATQGSPLEVQPEEAPLLLKPAQPGAIDVSQQRPKMLLATTLVGLVASQSARSWAERIDRTLANADTQQWHRLRSRPFSARQRSYKPKNR